MTASLPDIGVLSIFPSASKSKKEKEKKDTHTKKNYLNVCFTLLINLR